MRTLPITIVGETLGDRHRYLNNLVYEAHKSESFDIIAGLPEKSPIDRLFKIDLASKVSNIDYILNNLKDDDMLYVSRALKSKWLLHPHYKMLMNPISLEKNLYPEMTTTAANKMRHWIHLNLKDEERCKDFYMFYIQVNRNLAFKFLPKCSVEIIINEIPIIVNEITPHLLKVLCERTPLAAKIFYEAKKNRNLKLKYKTTKYFDSIKSVLKNDIDLYLDILEQYFSIGIYKRLSPTATKFIVTNRKDRFFKKPELYTSQLLNIKAVAECLSVEECERLVIHLARCKFLSYWFDYKSVEPFIKRLTVEKRSEFKNKVFVRKEIGEEIKDWPYPLPGSSNDDDDVVLEDECDIGVDDCSYDDDMGFGMKFEQCAMKCAHAPPSGAFGFVQKTELDKLFDEYRFKSFDKTLIDLRQKISAESSSQSRMNMMLVLISKSGGKMIHLDTLFELLVKHLNEPAQVRAAVIRSLTKRAFVWRITDERWRQLLLFGRGLGLDGDKAEAECLEGLHAVVIRNLLLKRECSILVKQAYLKNFSTFVDYALSRAEKEIIMSAVLKMLISCVNNESDMDKAIDIMEHILEILDAYKIQATACPDVVSAIKTLASKDIKKATGILVRLFQSKIGRKELFKENFGLIQTDASYVNALRHDTTVLSEETFVKALKSDKFDTFLKKMTTYFNGEGSLSSRFLNALKKEKPSKELARPLAFLIGDELIPYILEMDKNTEVEIKRFAAVFRSNAHLSRPVLDINSLEWKTAGAKMIANRILTCRFVDIDDYVKKLIASKRTAKLAVILSQRNFKIHEVFPVLANKRATAAYKLALSYFKREGDKSDDRVWEFFKPLFQKVESSVLSNPHLQKKIKSVKAFPLKYQPEYIALVLPLVNKKDFKYRIQILQATDANLTKINENSLNSLLTEFLTEKFNVADLCARRYDYKSCSMYIEIIGKYLLLCTNKETQDARFEDIGTLFLTKMEYAYEFDKTITNYDKYFYNFLTVFLDALKYEDVYFDVNYESCLNVMEKVVKWMQTLLPMEKDFAYYGTLHLNMLYYKTARQCLKHYPEIFKSKIKREREGMEIFGNIFGKYIAREVNELVSKYFDSIVELYAESLIEYTVRECRQRDIIIPLIKGMLQESKGAECRLVACLLTENYIKIKVNETQKQEIYKLIKEKNDQEMQFFLYNMIDI